MCTTSVPVCAVLQMRKYFMYCLIFLTIARHICTRPVFKCFGKTVTLFSFCYVQIQNFGCPQKLVQRGQKHSYQNKPAILWCIEGANENFWDFFTFLISFRVSEYQRPRRE